MTFDYLREVTWVEAPATDRETRTELHTSEHAVDKSIEERLGDLGHR